MKISRCSSVVLAILFALVFETDSRVSHAQAPALGPSCLYALDSNADRAFQIAGAQSVYTACGVVVESRASDGFEMEGSETLYLENHAQVGIVGGAQLNGQTLWDTLSNKQVQPVKISSPGDPLGSIAAPTSGTIVSRSHAYFDMNARPTNNTLSPGVYCGGLTIGNTNGTSFTFSPGVYIMAGGGFVLNSQAVVKGSGISIYNTSSTGWGCASNYTYAPVTISGQVSATLSAPTSGPLVGILFFGNRTGCATPGSCVDQINGGSTAVLNGALYFASDEIEITGSNASGYTALVADKIYINGNSNFGENGSPFDNITVSVSPSTASLFANQTQQFTATVNNTGNTAVTWTISPSSAGSISSSGLYTAPSSVASQQTVTVTATSQADNTKIGTATITLLPPQTPVITWATPAPITYGTALSATQLDATVNAPGTLAYSPSLGTVLTAGIHTLTVTFTPANPSAYTPATASVTLVVNQAVPSVAWGTPAAITYGTALSGTQLDATANVPGTFAYSPATGAVPSAGQQTLSVTFTPSDATDYATATAAVTLTVNKATPAITWAAPAAIVYGTALSSAQLDATANVPGTFVYSPASGAILTAGTQTLSVTFTPTDTTDYTTATANVTLTVNKATPSITWATPAAITFGTALSSSQLDAAANVPGTFAYSPTLGTVLTVGSQTLSVTFTPTDTTDYTTVSATVMLTIAPPQCAIQGYTYERAIVIDHTKVPNTDQANFPLLFSATDAEFVSVANGGHIASSSGNDIYFSVDPTGINRLDYELGQYNPQTGQIVAWIRVPTLTHATNTVLYMFYGNPAITSSQANPGGVWKNNFQSVYHLSNVANGTAIDSTGYNNTVPATGLSSAGGEFGSSAAFDGASAYFQLPGIDYSAFPASGYSGQFAGSFAAWFKTTSQGVILGQNGGQVRPGGSPRGWIPALYVDNQGLLRGDFFNVNTYQITYYPETGANYSYTGAPQIVSSNKVNDGQWHFAALTYGNGTETLYLDGAPLGIEENTAEGSYNTSYQYFVGTGYDSGWANTSTSWGYFNGDLEEVEVSAGTRSSDWLQAEYFNQSSSATFYTLSPEITGTTALAPGTVSLRALEAQQFTVIDGAGTCGGGSAVWSMPAGSPGTLSPDGLYTAPATIDTAQRVTITATTLGASSTNLTATITLMPPVAISVAPGITSLPASGTQQFNATVSNTSNTSVQWTLVPAGLGTLSGSGLYTAPATVSGQTVSVIATSQADRTQSASATVTLGVPAPTVPTVTVNPQTAIVYASGMQQFTATVTNTTNTAVTWSVSPAGEGSIDANGLYTAPANISSQQTVTVTATSQANTAVLASATIALAPLQCAPNGYSYVRAVTIDHTKIPNTDQTNFPFLFSVTDPLLATTANGGHVSNSNGYDIIFSADPNGQSTLNYEMEKYDPVSGQVVAWVSLPNLSHSANTFLYIFYGNSSITTSQQNSTGVWDSNYGAVWHLGGSGTGISTSDSTVNANNATIAGQASSTQGEIGYGAALTGSPNYIDAGNKPGVQPTHTGTMSIWVYYNTFANWTTPMGNGNTDRDTNGVLFWNRSNGQLNFEVNGASNTSRAQAGILNTGQWYYLVGTWDGTTVRLYENGVVVGNAAQQSDASPAYHLTLGVDGALSGTGDYLNGSLDEARVSNIARSSDWVAAEYANQSSPSTFFSLSSESATTGISPTSVSLYASQSQQFVAPGLCSGGVSWSLSAGAGGTLTSTGLYTAPSSIAQQQNVTVTANSLANPGQSASATVTLLPPVSVTLSPGNVTLGQDQTQSFSATVSNSSNQAVTWSINPVVGSIDQSGGYAAPSSITVQQTITITATSVTDPTKSASAVVTLAPASGSCVSAGYGYQRVIVIDHSKVANTDQIDFPFLFNTTDPALATDDHGGQVANPNGYDIIFSTDPNGQTKLDHEVEEYNPATGQLIAWVRIPNLSHTTDTVIYLLYGNANVTTSQQNPGGVWNSKYQAVYHLGNAGNAIISDSTSLQNNGTPAAVTATPGVIDGGGAFNGRVSYIQIPSADFPNYPTGVYNDLGLPSSATSTTFAASFGVWFKTATPGGLLTQVPTDICTDYFAGCLSYAPTEPGAYDPSGWWPGIYLDDTGAVVADTVTTQKSYTDNRWHYAVWTMATDGTEILYVDGQVAGSTTGNLPQGYSPDYSYFLGASYTFLTTNGNWNWLYFNGSIDEVTIADQPLSADWIQTEYNNQASPSTFYSLSQISGLQVVPSAISLYAGQTQQFAVPGACTGSVTWSLTSGAGTLSPAGLFTAPSAVSTAQNSTITATSTASGNPIGSANVSLLPPPSPITLSANSQPPYSVGTVQSFTATLLDQNGNPQAGNAVYFTVTGVNGGSGSATTNQSGIATFTYKGGNAGTDSVQASANFDGELVTSGTVSAAWVTPPPPVEAAGVSLVGPPSLGAAGLIGAFTDGNGAVIEPVAIGAASTELIVPAGATQLQLGVNSEYYAADGGTGFTVLVNGAQVTVPPTAMPWVYAAGGLNNAYQFGVYAPSIQSGVLDGSAPIVAAKGLSAGQIVAIAYVSGTVSLNPQTMPLANGNGDSTLPTGAVETHGTYFPTLYTTATAYPLKEPVSFSAVVTGSNGQPVPGVPVTLNISGANPQSLQATTDATGTATFLYIGQYAGTDTLQAVASPSSGGTLDSSLGAINWVSYAAPPSSGSLSLAYFTVINDVQSYTALANDASGNPQTNTDIEFYAWGADNASFDSTTDGTGHSAFQFIHTIAGGYSVVAIATIDRNVVVSNVITGTWTPPNSTQACVGCNQVTVSVSAQPTVVLPNALQLNGTVTDNVGVSPTIQWSQVSGPGVVTFANPQQAVTTATFTVPGVYVLQLYATDTGASATAQFQVTVKAKGMAVAGTTGQGWIGSPLYGAAVSGVVPVTLAPGKTLQSGTLIYAPASNSNAVTVLNSNVSGSGQIGTFDTTTLQNGGYWIQMTATDTSGNTEYSLILVEVSGNYKPGRVTTTVTDLVVPVTGLPINIRRTYDSLNAGISSDFGFGWSLGINVNLAVDPQNNVTFTLGGQRKTFYFASQQAPCSPLIGCPFGFVFSPTYTPQPGLHGTLVSSGAGCAGGLDILNPDGSCQTGGPYTPPGYIYTDPNGTAYTIAATGALQSINDRNGNGLTITSAGITSTTGLNVPFVRDSQNRITQITDPLGNIYSYAYDASGNLASVTYPNTPQPSTYTYDPNHLYLSGTDFRSNPLPSTSYFTSSDTDPNGLPLNGRLRTVTDGLGETTTYAYDLVVHSITITYPPDAGGNVGKATMVYDTNGDLLSSTDPLGHTTTNVFDSDLNRISTTDPLGQTTSYTYDVNGNKTSQTYPATATSTNTTSTTTYNFYSEPTSTTDENGNIRTFSYDANSNPASITDSVGTLMSTLFNSNGTMQAGVIGYDLAKKPARASQFSYDGDGNLAAKTDALGRTTSYTYDTLGHKIAMIEPVPSESAAAAATTTYQYDAFGNLTQTSAPLGRVTKSQYDPNSNKISDADARSNTTRYQYDALNRLVETDYPDGTKATKSYDFRGKLVTETDQNGHVTQRQYDLAGRQISVTQAYGTSSAQTTTYAYDAAGRKTSETDALGHTTTYTYDAAGNLTSISGVKGNFQYGYDNARNQVSVTDGNSNTTKYRYDARKRLIETDYPDGTKKTNAYDGPGNLASVTDQAGNQVQYTYDAANQLQTVVQVSSPNSPANTSTVGYDVDGNPIAVQDANWRITAGSFDLLGELTTKTLPDATLIETRQYDQNGNLTSLTHFNGVTTTYAYDSLNRLLSRATPGETTVSFTYTPSGKRQTMADASGTTTYSYDPMDRLIVEATPEGTLSYTYDAAGNLASMSSNHTNGVSVTYGYDGLNRLTSVVDGNLAGAGTTTYSYDSASNLGTVAYPNGVQTTFTYDQLNRVSTAVSPVSGYSYQRGPTGNLANVAELSGRTVNWTYDGIYRLTKESITNDPSQNNGSASYGLDPVGNRTSASSSLNGIPSGSWGFNADDEISSESYDQNGNVTAASGKTFVYDSENHLVSMNGGAVQIIYDGDGNRVAKSVQGVITQYLVDDLNPTGYSQVVEEMNGTGIVQRQYTYGLQRISQNQPVNNTWTVSFYGYDGGGSARNLTNSSGSVTDRYDYDGFGNELNHSGSTPNPYLYRGEFLDGDLGLYYLRARYMNPITGRFMSRDPKEHGPTRYRSKPVTPISPWLLHQYLYSEGNPANVIDPLGLEGAEEYEIGVYRSLKKATAFTDLEAHHIIQARFAPLFNVDPGDMLAIAVNNLEHSALDLAWMDAIPYGTTAAATQADVLEAALDIYVDYPDVYDWLITAWEIE